jgi:hypothetical protein
MAAKHTRIGGTLRTARTDVTSGNTETVVRARSSKGLIPLMRTFHMLDLGMVIQCANTRLRIKQ